MATATRRRITDDQAAEIWAERYYDAIACGLSDAKATEIANRAVANAQAGGR